MPKSVDRIYDQTGESDIISHQKVNYISLSCFFYKSYHLLDCKIISDRFFFFFFFFFFTKILSLPLSKTPSRRHLYKTKALSVLYKPD